MKFNQSNVLQAVAPDNIKHLGDFLSELPTNGYLDKVTTGCGLTTLAIKQAGKTIIAVPYVNLVRSKQEYCKSENINMLCIYEGGDKVSDIHDFTGTKIMCTYDQLRTVSHTLNATEWDVVIDEAHLLLASAGYRATAVHGVLESYSKFKSYLFASATPHYEEYDIPELAAMQKYQIKWSNLKEVNVQYTQLVANTIPKQVAALILQAREGVENVHIFMNSLNGILSAIKFTGSDDIKIVCADNEYNRTKLKAKNKQWGTNLVISHPSSEPTKVNFYTSTAFEGIDVMDKTGHTYVVIDGTKEHTAIDITTTLPQIIGRLRNSIYNNVVHLWYTGSNPYIQTTEELFTATVNQTLAEKRIELTVYQQALSLGAKMNIKGFEGQAEYDNFFYKDSSGTFQVNELAKQAEIANWKTVHQTYRINKFDDSKSGITEHSTDEGVPTSWTKHSLPPVTGLTALLVTGSASFEDLCKEYILNQDSDIAKQYPIIKQAFDTLGASALGTAQYKEANIKKALIMAQSNSSVEAKLIQLFKYKIGSFITLSQGKEYLQQVYNDLGITKTAKASDIEKFYHTKNVQRRINGEKVNGLEIISPKF